MRSGFLLFAVAVGASFAAVASGCAAGSAPTEAPPPAPAHTQHASKHALSTEAEFCAARAAAECSSAVLTACGFSGKSDCESKHGKSCMGTIPQGTTYQPSK